MKITKKLVMLLIMSLIVSACSSPITDSADKIVSPRNQLIPVKGTWKVSKVLTSGASNEEDKEKWLGKKVQFSNIYMSIGESILEDPQYKIKKVKGEQYLLFNSKSLPADFEFPNQEVEVITIIDKDKFFCEVLIIEEDELVLKIQGNSLYLKRTSEEVDEYIPKESNSENKENTDIQTNKDEKTDTGVLIGLRYPNEKNSKDSIGDYSYRTLWISSTNKEENSILEMENIFFPRRSGFWKMQIEKAKQDGKSEEYILAHNVLMEDSEAEEQAMSRVTDLEKQSIEEKDVEQEIDFYRWGERLGEVKRKIDYVGNDYISVETLGKGGYILGDKTWEKSKLQLLPVDGLPNGEGVNISDILDETGATFIKSAWKKAINYLEIDKSNMLYSEEVLENFGLERKLGHWLIEGRINYIKNNEFKVADYSVNLIPPSKVVFYDDLHVPWTNIKDRVPRALDAYTSPNKDIAIVFTRKELLVYNIYGNELGRQPKESLKLKEGEISIMAEWATGHYVESWESIFKDFMEE